MKPRRKDSTAPKGLRAQAEHLLRETRREVAQMRPDDVQKLVHELQVHQIELEMQNDELRRTQLELEQARDRYTNLYDFAPVGYVTLDAAGVIQHANLIAASLLGVNRGKLISTKLAAFITAEYQGAFSLHRRRVARSRVKQTCELQFRRKDGSAFFGGMESIIAPGGRGNQRHWLAAFADHNARKQAEERIAQLSRVQTILASIDRAIVHIHDRQKLLDEVCRVAVEKGGFKLAWIGMVAPDGSVQPVAKAGATGYLKGIRVVTHDVPEGRGPVGTAIRENRPVVIEDIDQDARMAPWHDRALRFGLHYVAAFPIRIADKVAGCFSSLCAARRFL